MRILVVHPGPQFSVHDLFVGWTEALDKLGLEVAGYNLDDRLTFYANALMDTGEKDENGNAVARHAMTQVEAMRAASQGLSHALYTMWPDVVIFISAFFIPGPLLQVVRTRRHKIVLIHTESPYQEDEQLQRAQFADINLLNDPVNIERYDELGYPALYAPHAYRPEVHHPRTGPLDPALACDLAFIGTGFESRIKFFEAMNLKDLDVILGGNWMDLAEDSPLRKHLAHEADECCDNEEAARVYQHAKAGINFYRRETEKDGSAAGWAIGPREVEMAACGLFFLRESRGEGDGLFPSLPLFDGPEDAIEKLRWWLARPAPREAAALEARHAIAGRTFENNAKSLLKLLDNLD